MKRKQETTEHKKRHNEQRRILYWKNREYELLRKKDYLKKHPEARRKMNEQSKEWQKQNSQRHRRVVEKVIGRGLNGRQEIVHHIDGDFTNNEPENLYLMKNAVHSSYHNRISRWVLKNPTKPIIEYDGYIGKSNLDNFIR